MEAKRDKMWNIFFKNRKELDTKIKFYCVLVTFKEDDEMNTIVDIVVKDNLTYEYYLRHNKNKLDWYWIRKSKDRQKIMQEYLKIIRLFPIKMALHKDCGWRAAGHIKRLYGITKTEINRIIRDCDDSEAVMIIYNGCQYYNVPFFDTLFKRVT